MNHTYCPECGWWVPSCPHRDSSVIIDLYWCAACGRYVVDCPHH